MAVNTHSSLNLRKRFTRGQRNAGFRRGQRIAGFSNRRGAPKGQVVVEWLLLMVVTFGIGFLFVTQLVATPTANALARGRVFLSNVVRFGEAKQISGDGKIPRSFKRLP